MSRAKNLKRRCQVCGSPATRSDYVYYSRKSKQYAHAHCHPENRTRRPKRTENREWWRQKQATGPRPLTGTSGAEMMPNAFIVAVANLQQKAKEVRKSRTRTR